MVTVEFEDGTLYVKCSGSDFQEQIESCHYLKMKFDAKSKRWATSPGKIKEVLDEFSQYGVQFSEYDKIELNKYIDSLSNFSKIVKRSERRKYSPFYLSCLPAYDFQAQDIEKAINQSSLLFKWSTGTGKSFALAGILTALRDYKECKKALILTSSIGIMNLNSELKKFIEGYDQSKTLVIGSITELKGDERAVFDRDDIDIIICGYDSFKAICTYYDQKANPNAKKSRKFKKSSVPLRKWYGDGYKSIVFFDECHLIGNHNSQRNACILMNEDAWDYRFLFSATPTDKEEKFYPTLRLLDKALVKGMSYTDWLSQFCELGTRFSAYAPNKSTWNEGKWKALQDTLAGTYIVNRDKKLLNLPDAIDMDLIVLDMSPEQRAVYEAFSYINLELIKARNEENGHGIVNELINSFQIQEMAVENPEMILTSKVMDSVNALDSVPQKILDDFHAALKKFDYKKHFRKLDALAKILEYECDEMDNKVIVFYVHPKTLEHLRKEYPNAYVISAEESNDERFKIVEDFRSSKEKVLIASVNIANTSFTLTECKAAVFYERPWSGLVYEQARGRIHRIGQEDEVRYYNMCYDNSIDDLQLRTLETKGRCIEGIGRKTHLSGDDWKTIFGGSIDQMNLFLEKML